MSSPKQQIVELNAAPTISEAAEKIQQAASAVKTILTPSAASAIKTMLTSSPISHDFEVHVISQAMKVDLEEDEELCRRKVEEEAARQKFLLRRPWACNILLAYLVHPRCFRLAKHNPVFDLQELIYSMFQ
jgi:hypothetical protein